MALLWFYVGRQLDSFVSGTPANPGTRIPVLPNCDPVGAATFLFGERVLFHVRFAELSPSGGHREWSHLYHLVHGFNHLWDEEDGRVREGRNQESHWKHWSRYGSSRMMGLLRSLERNWGAHYHLRLC